VKGNRVLLRLSVRAIRRAPLRSLLIVALIGLMVAVGSLVATVSRTTRVTEQDRIDGEIGSADLVVSVSMRTDGATQAFGGFFSVPGGCANYGIGVEPCMAEVVQQVPCFPGQVCGFEPQELTPGQQAALDDFNAWRSALDVEETRLALAQTFGAEVTVSRQASRADQFEYRSPFSRFRGV